jgi:hypothetical protein
MVSPELPELRKILWQKITVKEIKYGASHID